MAVGNNGKRFNELYYSGGSKWNDKKRMKIGFYVPGVNSGMYSKELCINVSISEPKLISVRLTHANITLNAREVEELRDECNKILELTS